MRKHLESRRPDRRLLSVEPADKLTVPQIVSRVKAYYDQRSAL
jgi:hypothetical protein